MGGGDRGWGGRMEMATGVCFKLSDAVSGTWEWNALERGFLCPTGSRAGVLGDWNISSALQAGTQLAWAVQAPMGSHICQGAVVSAGAKGESSLSRGVSGAQVLLAPQHQLLPLTCSWMPGNPAAAIAHQPHLSKPGPSSFSVPAEIESGAASGAGTTGPNQRLSVQKAP